MSKNLTRGEQKILNGFIKITKTDAFEEEILKVRKTLGIPLDGIKLTKEQLLRIDEHIKKPHKDEFSRFADFTNGFQMKTKSEYPSETKKLLSIFPVMNEYFSLLIRNYIYYNVLLIEELGAQGHNPPDLCYASHAEDEADAYFIDDNPDNSSGGIRSHNERIAGLIYDYPVSIRIHTDASQRDISNFIKENWKTIKGYQAKYQTKKGNLSLKNIRVKINKITATRNDFIYEHRELPRREIMNLVSNKFKEFLDQGHIGKIISLEKNKRKKV